MKKFKLPITFEAYGEIEVKAETLEEAVNKINKQIDLDTLKLPAVYDISSINLTEVPNNKEETWKWYKILNSPKENALYEALNKVLDRGGLSLIEDISVEEENSIALFLTDGTKKKLFITEIENSYKKGQEDNLLEEILEELDDAAYLTPTKILFKNQYVLHF